MNEVGNMFHSSPVCVYIIIFFLMINMCWIIWLCKDNLCISWLIIFSLSVVICSPADTWVIYMSYRAIGALVSVIVMYSYAFLCILMYSLSQVFSTQSSKNSGTAQRTQFHLSPSIPTSVSSSSSSSSSSSNSSSSSSSSSSNDDNDNIYKNLTLLFIP